MLILWSLWLMVAWHSHVRSVCGVCGRSHGRESKERASSQKQAQRCTLRPASASRLESVMCSLCSSTSGSSDGRGAVSLSRRLARSSEIRTCLPLQMRSRSCQLRVRLARIVVCTLEDGSRSSDGTSCSRGPAGAAPPGYKQASWEAATGRDLGRRL